MRKLRTYGVVLGCAAGMVAGGAAYLLWFALFESYLMPIPDVKFSLFLGGAVFVLALGGPAWFVAHRWAQRTLMGFVGVGVLYCSTVKALTVAHAFIENLYDEQTLSAMRRFPLDYWSEQVAQPIIFGLAVGTAIFLVAYQRDMSTRTDVFR